MFNNDTCFFFIKILCNICPWINYITNFDLSILIGILLMDILIINLNLPAQRDIPRYFVWLLVHKIHFFLTLVKRLAEVFWCKLYTLSNTQTSYKSTDKLSSKILGKYKFRNIIFNPSIILFHDNLQMLFIIYWKQIFWIKFRFLLINNESYNK